MNVTCPSCGAGMDLDVLLAHEDSRAALGRLVQVSLPLAKLLLQYLRLFKPATRQMSHGRTVTLIEQLLPDLQRGQVERNGRDWLAPVEIWRAAIERVLEQRDNGKLALPLKSHGYLYEVIFGLADKAEAQAERNAEAQHRSGATAVDLAPAAAVLPYSTEVMRAYSTPSPYAQRLKANIQRTLAEREQGAAPTGEATP